MESNNFGKETKKVIEIITEIVNSKGKSYKIKFKDIKNWKKSPGEINNFQDTSINRGLKALIKTGIIFRHGKKKNEIHYQLNPNYVYKAFKIGRQNSDVSELQSFPLKEVINLTTNKSKTTVYGLPEEVFHKTSGRNFDYSQKETLKFKQGMTTKDVFGRYFGISLPVKIRAGKSISDEDLLNDQVNHYLNLIVKEDTSAKKNKKVKTLQVREESLKELIKHIINAHRNKNIQFYELGENISSYLVELKREHRRRTIGGYFEEDLKKLPKGKLKLGLSKFKSAFVGILAHTDHDEEFLKKSIFEFYGQGVGGYSFDKEPKLFLAFNKFVMSLENKEKRLLFDFVWKIFKQSGDLYPTHTAFICRGHSIDILPEEIPLNIGNK